MQKSQKENKLDKSQVSIVGDQLMKLPTPLLPKKIASTPAKNLYKAGKSEPM